MIKLAFALPLFLLFPFQEEKPKQEDPKPETKEEEIVLDIVVGKRPASADMQMPQPQFTLKEPLTLEGLTAKEDALRAATAKGLLFLLERQQEDGTWKFDPKTQVREDVPKNERYFVPTATQTMSVVVTTSLCCLALRAHEALAPERIRAAVAKALPYVLENAPKHDARQYAVWTWSFAIEFLVGEYKREKDEEQKEKILTSIRGTVDKLLGNQHAGAAKVPGVLPKNAKKADSKSKDEKRDKGYFGVTPAGNLEDETPGILIQNVQKNGPASKGGLQKGDRILEINGVRVTGMEHLYEAVAELVPGETAKVKVLRGAKAQASGTRRARTQDGGWGYYGWMEAATNCSATAILALTDAKAIGVHVPQDALNRGLGYLTAAKMLREETDEIGFRYTMLDNGDGLDVRASVARIAPCTYALHQGGVAEAKEVEKAIEIFVRRRGELDKVLGYPGNHVYTSYFNSAYYFLWSHYNTARALAAVKDEEKRARLGAPIQEALLKHQREAGTWTDHEAWGQLYGTAMALMALGELKFLTPGAYKTVVPTLEKKERRVYR